MTERKLYLDGHTCLNCGVGWYDGYVREQKLTRPGWLTRPCTKCGHQAPARMLPSEFRRKVLERDSKNE